MKNISVIGAGTMGNGIAHHLSLYNFTINLIDISKENLEKGISTINKNLQRQADKEKITSSQKEAALKSIHPSTSLENAKGSDLVIEAATENPHIKKEILRTINHTVTSKCIIASNTSSISITELGSTLDNPAQFIGMHFMNPVPVMKLVEIIKGYSTSPQTLDKIYKLSLDIGKTPVVVNDYPGFISNRILMPMINEAIYSLHERVAGVEEIDTIMMLGMAHPMGPLKLADFIGLDICLSILKVLHEGFGNPKYAPCPLLINMVNAGKLGAKTGEGFYDWSKGKDTIIISQQFLI